MRKIFNHHTNSPEWIINEDEKELIDLAIHNLAVSMNNPSLTLVRGVGHE